MTTNKEGTMQAIGVWLETKVVEQLDERAAREGVSRSELIRCLLREGATKR